MNPLTPKKWILLLLGYLVVLGPQNLAAQLQPAKVKIFILAGQSNMEGKGSVEVMEHQLSVPGKAAQFQRYRNGQAWVEREDVFIDYLGGQGRRTGRLGVGFGTSKKDDRRLIGPELGFGWTVGDHFEAPVLIIKTAWGGKSLDRDFRPPSRGFPESMKGEFDKRQKRNEKLTLEEFQKSYGHFYRAMIEEVKTVTKDLKTYVPGYQDQGYELAGLVWFQGWNDQYAPTSIPDYEQNMIAFIDDVRKALNAPGLPVVIGAMGHDGAEQKGKIKQIADAQANAAEQAKFKGTVQTIRTSKYWDVEAHAAYKKYWADKPNRDIEKWREYGNDHPYHYLGSPKFFNDVGIAFAKAMIPLIDQ